jgi:hypothetical protein
MTRGATGEQRLVRLDEVLAQSGVGAERTRDDDGSQWIGIRQAAKDSGVSISTLRNWYRKGLIESRLMPGPNGEQRMVRSEEVMSRAAEGMSSTVASDGRLSGNGAGLEVVPAARSLPDLVRELALARERAGRAETKAEFLSDQLAETKERVDFLENESPVRELKEENTLLR